MFIIAVSRQCGLKLFTTARRTSCPFSPTFVLPAMNINGIICETSITSREHKSSKNHFFLKIVEHVI